MEKAVVFGPIILFFVIFGLLVLAFLGFIFKLIMKSKNSSWQGTVMDKIHNEKRDYDSKRMEHFYYLVVDTQDRNGMKVGLSEQMWNGFNIGDKIKKDKGKLFPEKI